MHYITPDLEIVQSTSLTISSHQTSILQEEEKAPLSYNSKILILALSGIGDAIMFSPALSILRKSFPEHTIDLLTMFKGTADIYAENKDINKIHFWNFLKKNPFASLKFLLSLRHKYSHTITVFPANRWPYAIISWLIGSTYRIGHSYLHVSNQQLQFLHTISIKEIDTLHNCEENIRLVSLLGATIPEILPPLTIPLSEESIMQVSLWKSKQENISAKDILIGFHAGSAIFKNQINKRWDYKEYAELAKLLISKYNAKILLFGGPEELELNVAIKNEISLSIGTDSVHIVQMPSLMGSIALMQECKAFISNDSGLMHIAAALQLPQISIFGYTSHIHTAPWGNSNALVARRALECSPCFYFSPKSAHCKFSGTEKEFSCIREIKAHDIFHRLQALIH